MTTTTLHPLHVSGVPTRSRAVAWPPRMGAERVPQLVALLGSLSAAALFTYIVIALPNRLMLSEYVHVPGGLVPFVCGLLALAVGTSAVARLVQAHGGPAVSVLRVCTAASVVTAAFPTDPTRSAATSLSGQVHRWAAAVVFLGLPLAGWLVARGSATGSARAVRCVVAASALATAMTLLLNPLSPLADVIGHPGWEGGFQRMLAAADVVLVGAIAAGHRRLVGDHHVDHIGW